MKLTVKELSDVIAASRQLEKLLTAAVERKPGFEKHFVFPHQIVETLKAAATADEYQALSFELRKIIRTLNLAADKLEEATVTVS